MFMKPRIWRDAAYEIETTEGTEIVLLDVVGTLEPAELVAYLRGKMTPDAPFVIVRGWFCNLSADGYMDQTDVSGPFTTAEEAKKYLCNMYGLCEECMTDECTCNA